MKILLVRHTGALGKIVHKGVVKSGTIIITASRNSRDYQIDFSKSETIEEMFKEIDYVDTIISAIGVIHYGVIQGSISEAMAKCAITAFVKTVSYGMEDVKRINIIVLKWNTYGFRNFHNLKLRIFIQQGQAIKIKNSEDFLL
ncbi:TPA: hypothetical protein OTT57_002007 [Enterococcus faecalis]|nr:hypothetical protein [Enterococcus faecalis]